MATYIIATKALGNCDLSRKIYLHKHQMVQSSEVIKSSNTNPAKGQLQYQNTGSTTWNDEDFSSNPDPSNKTFRFTYDEGYTSTIGTFIYTNVVNCEYFEVGSPRTQPLFESTDGTMNLMNVYLHDIVLEDCSLIQIAGPSLAGGADLKVDILLSHFERIALHKATDVDPV
ncbi:MAG: hypothetical protein EZS28_001250 [Streblomastix strix]|uniref:Uncharacterized protein n=1 Tax=Streblomastix strix TaxID=222440 RepID=A0A5J4X9H2_9EUKA|nr:MAG: hypothetical protein EZS28_001250 [Streblomastix strix]